MKAPQQEPSDTRIIQARAAIDDARTLVAEMIDDFPETEWQVMHWLQEGRKKLNSALGYLEKIQ